MRRVLISTKPFIFVLFPVVVTVRSAESLSSAIPLGTSTERANSKRANHGRSRLFQDAVRIREYVTALTSIKRVGDLQAFSVSEECLVFGPVYSHVVLRPRPGYVPKVPTTPFRDQVVNLQALPSEEADPALALLCPIRALRIYVDPERQKL